MLGCSFLSQPSLSNAGGVGFFVSDPLSFHVRNDLSVSTVDYECLWINIQSNSNEDLVCGVIHRHPTSDLDAFLVYLNENMHKISKKRCCIIMGDFNLNLLNIIFNPHISQPTRMTHHSATLIDNVFFNSMSHHIISGNIVYDLTDHLPNFLVVNNFITLPKCYIMFKRDFSNFYE